MKKTSIILLIMFFVTTNGWGARNPKMVSPNGKITLEKKGEAFTISWNQQRVIELAQVGMKTTATGQGLAFKKMSKRKRIRADYQMLTGKRLHCTNQANEYVCQYQDAQGKSMRVVFRIYNDGIAFRYELTGLQDETITDELTTYRITEGTRRWMQQWSDGYEGFFPLSTTGTSPSPRRGGGSNTRWGYPSLIESADGVFTLLSEANIERQQSASCLRNDKDKELYRVCPDQNECKLTGDWHSPWRVAIVGTLADIVESTLITDVSNDNQLQDISWIHPGVVSWIYWAYNHGSNDFNIIKKYVDMAVTLHLPYVLIDAEWDEMKDGKTIEDALNYAKSQGVRPLIWYNSSVGWINGAPGPKFRLNKPEDREREFAWCERMGVAGVKIDFFSGDNQMNMNYCIDLMESAAKHHLLINFHGATIPRGWQRTYPNLLTTEGVYGAEWYNNVPTFTNRAAAHNAMLPFTRNVIGPMDYTPCTFSDSQHPHITSNAHELALTILFESGLQHLADKPESYLTQPQEVQDFLSTLPSVWDETRLLSGYPGESVVMARRRGNTWYIAGINGTDGIKTLYLPHNFIQTNKALMFADLPMGRRETHASRWNIQVISDIPESIDCQPRGGFVIVVKP